MFPCDGLYRAYISRPCGCGYSGVHVNSGKLYISSIKKEIEQDKAEKPSVPFVPEIHPSLPSMRETRKASKHLKYWPQI